METFLIIIFILIYKKKWFINNYEMTALKRDITTNKKWE